MARNIELVCGELKLSTGIRKIDRDKVYGYTKTKTFDDEGSECTVATLTQDGRHVLPSGSTAIAAFDDAGNYLARDEMQVVDAEGGELTKFGSSFDAPTEMRDDVTIEEYLSVNVKSVYQLDIEDGLDDLVAALETGRIFHFPFCYRAGYDQDDAYLVTNDGAIFMVIGKRTEFEYISLDMSSTAVLPDEVADEEEDEFDFAML